MPEISIDELRQEIEKIESEQFPSGGAFTTDELRCVLGWTTLKTRDAIKRLIIAGVLQNVNVRRQSMLNTRTYTVPGFRLINKRSMAGKKKRGI